MKHILETLFAATMMILTTVKEEAYKFLCPKPIAKAIENLKGPTPSYCEWYCLDLSVVPPKQCPFVEKDGLFIKRCSKYNQELVCDNPKGWMNRTKKCQKEWL